MCNLSYKVSQDLAFFFFPSKGEIKTEDVSKKGQAEDTTEDIDVDVVSADQVIPAWVFQLWGQL